MNKQLNGPVLKSIKLKLSRPKSEKVNWPGPGQNLTFPFGPGRARAKNFIITRARAELRLLACKLDRSRA